VDIQEYNREARGNSILYDCCFGQILTRICAATTAMSPANGAPHMPAASTPRVSNVFGGRSVLPVFVTATSQNGWIGIRPHDASVMTSLATSTRINLASGQVTTGSHSYSGLPIVGFAARTFINGTLACGTVACQGNYGGAFALKYRRAIAPAN
jgi:hypothetical protein